MDPIKNEQLTAASGHGESWLAALYESAESLALWVERRKYLALIVGLIVYACFTVPIAQRKLIWDDEFFTLYISGAASFSEIWKALLTGADQHPPLFYFLTHTVFSVFGMSHLTLRLLAMLGFWLMMLCLYMIVARRTSSIYGLTAMMFPLLTTVVYYATEARGYGLVLGFGSLALLCWLCAADNYRRSFALPGLWLSLMLAVGSHYYAILLLLPLGVGELVRLLTTRRIDWAMVAAFTGVGLPLALFHTAIRRAQTYSSHFWAQPRWMQPFEFFPDVFKPVVLPLLAALTISFIVLQLRFPRRGQHSEQIRPVWQLHEISALMGFILLPFICTLVARLVTNAYHPRYVGSAFLSGIILILSGFYQAYGGRRSAGLMLCLLVLCSLPYAWLKERAIVYGNIRNLRATAQFLEHHNPESWPIVVAEVTQFHRLSYYAPRKLARQLIYAADPEKSVKYLRHNTVDRGLLDLRPWFPERIEAYRSVLWSYPRFLCYGYIGAWTWLTYALIDDQLETKLIGREQHDRLLIAVNTPRGEISTSESVPFHRDSIIETAFQRVERDWQDNALTMCDQWTKDTNCGLLRSQQRGKFK